MNKDFDSRKNTVRHPVEKGVARVPVFMQMEKTECGAVCLAMILAYYNKWMPPAQVRSDCGVSRDGLNARNIIISAGQYGLQGKGYRYETEELMKNGTFPCIVHWEFKHFVVLCGFKRKHAVINDPARGRVVLPIEKFDEAFTGVCLQFEPTDEFEMSGEKRSSGELIGRRLFGAGSALVFGILTTLVTSITGIINPAFTRVLVDKLLTGEQPAWLVPFVLLLCAVSLAQIITAAIQARQQIMITAKLEAVSSTAFFKKILRLPMAFFEQRMPADILERYNANSRVASQLIDTVVPLFFNAAMMLIYLIVMFRYNVMLACIGMLSVAINITTSVLASRHLMNILRCTLQDRAKLEAMTINGLEKIEDIKSSGGENGYFGQWAASLVNVSNNDTGFVRLSYRLSMLHLIMQSAADIAVLAAGVLLVMNGSFTVGMIMAFQGFLSSFSAPASDMIKKVQSVQELMTDMERIEDVMEHTDDEHILGKKADVGQDAAIDPYSKLKGNIEVKNVTFGYSKMSTPVLKDISFSVKQGQSVAVVGMSGCGKSTVAGLLSGLLRPWSGEILFDGRRIDEIDRAVFCGSLAVVDQEFMLFGDTIASNIKMWDDSIEDFEMIMAARDAHIHNEIVRRDGGYYYTLKDDGRDFSGGERQKLEIARVLAQDPTIVILDEATSALDAKNEKNVINSIMDRGITCVVIAHRLSTIRSCDNIIVLEHGEIAERGTHEELMKLDGLYRQLISSN